MCCGNYCQPDDADVDVDCSWHANLIFSADGNNLTHISNELTPAHQHNLSGT